ncbi:MAG TPA: cytochrome c [Acidobacteriaceae bacterium]|jgi:mono/diheme cytochrome c family protein|nr:cytochrome c [Acidobacteriaceae bacterium]
MNYRLRTAAMILLAASIAAPAFAQSAGADTYKAKCAMCHGPDGTAATPMGKMMKIPSFKAPDQVKATEASYIATTRDGKGKMPAYNGKLSDAQIKDVVSFIRTLQK